MGLTRIPPNKLHPSIELHQALHKQRFFHSVNLAAGQCCPGRPCESQHRPQNFRCVFLKPELFGNLRSYLIAKYVSHKTFPTDSDAAQGSQRVHGPLGFTHKCQLTSSHADRSAARFDQLKHLRTNPCQTTFAVEHSQNRPRRRSDVACSCSFAS